MPFGDEAQVTLGRGSAGLRVRSPAGRHLGPARPDTGADRSRAAGLTRAAPRSADATAWQRYRRRFPGLGATRNASSDLGKTEVVNREGATSSTMHCDHRGRCFNGSASS